MCDRVTRWGVIGAGAISTDFCLALRTLPANQHQLIAVAARDLSAAQQFANKHSITRAYNSYQSLTDDPDVDVVYIGTINTNHVQLSLMALNAGKHVLCEKPMALSAAEARKVINLARDKKLLFVEAFWSRFFPAYSQLRQELAAATIGDVKGLMVSFGFNFEWEKKERILKKELGAGVTKDIGVYPVQLACLVFDNEKPQTICTHGSLHETGIDRCANVMLGYKGGRTAQFTVSGDCQLPNTAVIYGTKGLLELCTPFWCPVSLKTPSKTYDYCLPVTTEPTLYPNSAGLSYEIQAMRQGIIQGLLELPDIRHEDSLLIAEIQDEILSQLGVTYNTAS